MPAPLCRGESARRPYTVSWMRYDARHGEVVVSASELLLTIYNDLTSGNTRLDGALARHSSRDMEKSGEARGKACVIMLTFSRFGLTAWAYLLS
jgi:hypothetical protein